MLIHSLAVGSVPLSGQNMDLILVGGDGPGPVTLYLADLGDGGQTVRVPRRRLDFQARR